jgi:ketopantoate reductase
MPSGATSLHLDGITGDTRIKIPATADIGEIIPCDVAIVLVDANGASHAAEVAWRILSTSGYALTLQNGIGNVETLSATLARIGYSPASAITVPRCLDPGM